jgi:SHS2 domain-containing protein
MTNQYKKIKIHPEEPVKQLITFEDIQNDRVSLFEKELNKKQEEFTNAMSIPTPPVPNFSDTLDQPLSEIELEIKRIQEQRNYDIEMINNTNKNNNASINENWLKPLETSIKNEKLMKINSIINSANNTKHISWEDEQQQYQQEETNIFNKLKKITNNDMDFENNNNNNHQLQIDEIKKEIFALNQKMDLILQKLDT